jgi:hypothetical protein
MVDRFMRAAEAYGLVTDYGVDGIQNAVANTLKEAAANGETVLSNGHDNNSLDEIALRQDATLSALPALPDGSGRKWKNADQGNKNVRIKEISFDYTLLKTNLDEDTGEALEPVSVSEMMTSHARDLKEQLALVRREFKQFAMRLLYGSIIIAAAVICRRG